MQYDKVLTNISNDILFICNKDGSIKYCNKSAEIFLGKEIKNFPYISKWADAQINLFCHYLADCFEQRQEQTFILSFGLTSYHIKMYPQRSNVAISMQDISENKKLRTTIYEMSQRLNFASKIAKIGYWELDLVSKKISWSTEMFRIFGIDDKEISVKKNIIRKQMHPEDLPRYKEKLRKILREGQAEEGVVRIIRPDGEMIYCRYKAEYLNYDQYNRKIVGTFQDLTEFIEIQQALEMAKETAERLNQEKSYFLAQASHDLQQPVTAMGLFINNLLNANLNGKQQILVGKIHDSAENLRNLLRNLLDISNLDANEQIIKEQEFSLENIIKRIKKEINFELREKKIKFKIVNCRQTIKSDAFLIERILRNYINNAVKYTKNKILVGCLRDKDKLKIMVLDNGIGISEKEFSAIFSPYYQSNNIPDNLKKGHGLGLAIVKKTADILNAKVGVKSKLGQGSCFYIEICIKI